MRKVTRGGEETLRCDESVGMSLWKEAHDLVLGLRASSAGAGGPVQESQLPSERPREDSAVSAASG